MVRTSGDYRCILQLNCVAATGTKIFLIGIHVKPDNAVSEIDSLADIYEYYTQLFGHGNSIILGVRTLVFYGDHSQAKFTQKCGARI